MVRRLWQTLAMARTLVERFDIAPYSDFSAKWSNFIGLVLFCIDTKLCKIICVWKLSPRSTQCTPLHSSAILIFCLKLKAKQFATCKICKHLETLAFFLKIFAIFWQTSSNYSEKVWFWSSAKECIIKISARVFQRVFSCKISFRYSRERAL